MFSLIQIDEIVYGKWNETNLWYLSQIISMDSKGYNLLFMDGYSKDNVPEKDLRKVPTREKKDKMIGRKFF